MTHKIYKNIKGEFFQPLKLISIFKQSCFFYRKLQDRHRNCLEFG